MSTSGGDLFEGLLILLALSFLLFAILWGFSRLVELARPKEERGKPYDYSGLGKFLLPLLPVALIIGLASTPNAGPTFGLILIIVVALVYRSFQRGSKESTPPPRGRCARGRTLSILKAIFGTQTEQVIKTFRNATEFLNTQRQGERTYTENEEQGSKKAAQAKASFYEEGLRAGYYEGYRDCYEGKPWVPPQPTPDDYSVGYRRGYREGWADSGQMKANRYD